MEDINVIITRIEDSTKSAHKRIDKIEQDNEKLRELIVSVKLLAQTVAQLQKDVEKVNKKLDVINEKPSKWIDLVKSTLISAFFGAIGAAVAALLLTK